MWTNIFEVIYCPLSNAQENRTQNIVRKQKISCAMSYPLTESLKCFIILNSNLYSNLSFYNFDSIIIM